MVINCKTRKVDLSQGHVMGILNVTPDSFFDGGRYTDLQAIATRVGQMLDQGATFIDIGGASSKPGGFQMNIQELGTIFQTQAAVKIVILNNDFLGMVRQWQQLFFDKRYASTEMVNPDFVKIAEGYFIESKRVTTRDDMTAAVAEMMKSDKPYLLEVCVEKENNVFPMIPSGASVSDIRLE